MASLIVSDLFFLTEMRVKRFLSRDIQFRSITNVIVMIFFMQPLNLLPNGGFSAIVP